MTNPFKIIVAKNLDSMSRKINEDFKLGYMPTESPKTFNAMSQDGQRMETLFYCLLGLGEVFEKAPIEVAPTIEPEQKSISADLPANPE
jgi:hypothetical protein